MIQNLLATKIVPVFYHESPKVCVEVMKAAYNAGLRYFEFVHRGEAAQTNFEAMAKYAQENLPEMVLGIGTILMPEDVAIFAHLGAKFVVSPCLNKAVGDACHAENVAWLPGCMTMTEIYQAHQWGAAIVKTFPGEVLGTAFVKNAKMVFPNIKIMVTGGVTPQLENLQTWFQAGADAVGIGSNLMPKNLIAEENFTAIQTEMEKVVVLAKTLRQS